MQSPFPTLIAAACYLLFVRIAPRYMKDREPFQMKPFLFVFNTAIVALNAYLSIQVRSWRVAICIHVHMYTVQGIEPNTRLEGIKLTEQKGEGGHANPHNLGGSGGMYHREGASIASVATSQYR